jgi:hypothetical protein
MASQVASEEEEEEEIRVAGFSLRSDQFLEFCDKVRQSDSSVLLGPDNGKLAKPFKVCRIVSISWGYFI